MCSLQIIFAIVLLQRHAICDPEQHAFKYCEMLTPSVVVPLTLACTVASPSVVLFISTRCRDSPVAGCREAPPAGRPWLAPPRPTTPQSGTPGRPLPGPPQQGRS
jgi:hypothetical protein